MVEQVTVRARSVLSAMPASQPLATQLLAGRAAIAAAILARPETAARALGADTATARRVTWLTRMMAVRDGALGVGGLVVQRRGGDPAPWLIGGAVADAVDAVVIAGALRERRLGGLVAAAVVPGALVAAAVGAVTAARLRR